MITSTQNVLVKYIVTLREPKVRKNEGVTIIDGVRELKRAFEAGIKPDKVLFCPQLFSGRREEELIEQLARQGVELIEVNNMVFAKMAFGDRHEGILALASVSAKTLAQLKLPANPLVVIVESVEKPGNLGAILRTCDGAGVDALIVCDPKTDVYNPNVIRASVGTVFSVPVVTTSKDSALKFLQQKKVKICGAFVDAPALYTNANLSGPLAITLGTEDEGLSDFWAKHADIKVKIPMLGIADSLNVSASAAIIIYEALRQRNK